MGHKVAIKEYLPNEFALRDGTNVHAKSNADGPDFDWGLARFVDEARTLARFAHPNVVRVRDYFKGNGTAYLVMDYEDGEPLNALLERHGTLTERQLRRVLLPVVAGLEQVHRAGYLHRDIKPSNIYVRRADESPVLLDFGAARQALGRKSKSLTAVATAGYSPPEQYESEGEQGPFTDIYALSALCYRAITGEMPIEAPRCQSRLLRGLPDPLTELVKLSPDGYSPGLLQAVDMGLRVVDTQRPQDLSSWLAVLYGESAQTPQRRQQPTGTRRREIRTRSKQRSKAASSRNTTTRSRTLAFALSLLVLVVLVIVDTQDHERLSGSNVSATSRLPETVAPRSWTNPVEQRKSPPVDSSFKSEDQDALTDDYRHDPLSTVIDEAEENNWVPEFTDSRFFTLGSHRDDVLRLQGTPTGIDPHPSYGEVWSYGLSRVTISALARTVQDWDNASSNLKVRLLPGTHVTAAEFFAHGSHRDDVLRLQGTPTRIGPHPSLGHERWWYGLSRVTISTATGRVQSWDNRSSNLKVRLLPGSDQQ